MIFDPLPVKFLPQKNCWFGPKIALFSVVNCPGPKNGVIKKFCCTKKLAKEGSKSKKKQFFQKKDSKDGKNKFWDLWDHNLIFGKSSDRFRTLTLPPLPARTVPRSRPHATTLDTSDYNFGHFEELWKIVLPSLGILGLYSLKGPKKLAKNNDFCNIFQFSPTKDSKNA